MCRKLLAEQLARADNRQSNSYRRTGAVDTWPLSMRFGNNRCAVADPPAALLWSLAKLLLPVEAGMCGSFPIATVVSKKMAEEIFILLICISRRILYIRNLIIRKLYVSMDLLSCELMI